MPIEGKKQIRDEALHRASGRGFYATKAAAEADAFSTRMHFKGFVERSGNWYAPRSIPADADVSVVQPPDAAANRSAVGPVVLGRPPAGAAKRPHPAGEDGRGAADDDEAKDHMYLKKSQKRGGPRKRKDWRRAAPQTPQNLARQAARLKAHEARKEASAKWRDEACGLLVDALADKSFSKLHALLVDTERGDDATGDLFVSEAQHHRVHLQAMCVYNYFNTIGASYPEKDLQWCADRAAEVSGFQVAGRTVYNWSLEYHQHRGFLVDKRGTYERCVFVEDEDVKMAVTTWITSHLRHLCRGKFACYVNNELIPQFVKGENAAVCSIMKEKYYVTLPVCRETCGMWMIRCGAKYSAKEQSFYHDKHEDPENRADRGLYVDEDQGTEEEPSLRELRQYQWIQMTEEKAKLFVAAHGGKDVGAAARLARLKRCAHEYKSPVDVFIQDGIVIAAPSVVPGDAAVATWRARGPGGGGSGGAVEVARAGAELVEFHVEVSELLDEWRDTVLFGGNLSHRMVPGWGALVVAGQDECIFQSEAATKKVWTMNGVSHLTPKTGVSLMVSGFTTGALGFGLELSEEQLAEVNEYRRRPANNTYVCGVYNAPQSLCALGGLPLSDKKPDLKESPGLRFIFNCKAADGYWTSAHMMVQNEDVTDVFRALYPWICLYMEFDHSGVHAIQKKDALNATKMNEKFGGVQPHKHSSVMTEGCLGPYSAVRNVGGVLFDVKLKAGDVQDMQFKEEDLPPFYAPDTPKEDTETGELVRPKAAKAKKQNKAALLMGGGDAPAAAVVEMVPGVRLGYVGKAKGFLDVLFERGWLDPAVKYTIKGPKLPDGTRDERKSLATIMARCEDFRNEATAMHELMGLLGVEMGQTPKGHPELAGRGIEFCWGKAKYTFRHINKYSYTKHIFEKTVREVLKSVTLQRSRRFLRKASDYKRAYRSLMAGAGPDAVAAYADVEKLRKLSKTHRSTFDQDYLFIARA